MPVTMVLKRTAEGKIITRDGKPSCTCCGTVDCYGLWGPGYDTLPATVTIAVAPIGEFSTEWYEVTVARVAKCFWTSPSPCEFGPYDVDYVRYSGGWIGSVNVCLAAGWVNWNGDKIGANGFTDGPLGVYIGSPTNARVS